MKNYIEEAKSVSKAMNDLHEEMCNVLIEMCKKNGGTIWIEPVLKSHIGLVSDDKFVVGFAYKHLPNPFFSVEGEKPEPILVLLERHPNSSLESYKKRTWEVCLTNVHITRLAKVVDHLINAKKFLVRQSIAGMTYCRYGEVKVEPQYG